MSDQHKLDPWDQDEVEIVDLGAPDRGLSRYLFALGEKWHTAGPLLARLVTLMVTFGLLIVVLQLASSGVITRTPDAPHIVPRYSLPSTIYIMFCVTTIDTSSSPGQGAITWDQFSPTPSTQKCSSFSRPGSQCPIPQQLLSTPPPTGQGWINTCSVGTPLPVSAGGNGKNR